MNKSVCVPFCRSTQSAAIAPPAPGRFSTTIEVRVICSTDSAKILAAVEEVPPAANPTTNVICPSFGSAGLESITSTAKNNGVSLGTWLILFRRISQAILKSIVLRLSIAQLLKETHSDWPGGLLLSGIAAPGRADPAAHRTRFAIKNYRQKC